jgi:sigma-B regulation protein RsbU (phosphoserine phosphatase)
LPDFRTTAPVSYARAEITIHANSREARRASMWLETAAATEGVPPDQIVRLDQCLDEALANVINHGGVHASAMIHLQLAVRRKGTPCTAELVIVDEGKPFDTCEMANVPRPKAASLAEANLGGLGLAMMRSFSDELRYFRHEGRNHLTICVRWTDSEPVRDDLDSIAIFRGVDRAAVREILKDCPIRDVPAGTILMEPGQTNDTIHFLLSGRLAAQLDDPHSPDTGIQILPGESVGELSVIDNKPVSAYVIAHADSRVLDLPGPIFWSRVAPIPGVMRNLISALTVRMRRSNEAILTAQRKHLDLVHLRRELQVARQLQTSMIPDPGRLFPERNDVEIAGMMTPASEVGGDFFDAFFVDDRHLFLCVGDVSGHGIPAALFMARTLGLVRIAAMGTRAPERLLERINEQMCAGNDANIFVTLFCAFLDVASGRLTYSNAGHLAPIVARSGSASLLPLPKGPLVGVIPGARYEAKEDTLDRGVTLVSFTDGVTEAYSAAGGEFSGERLLAVAAAHTDQSVEHLLGAVQAELARFLGNQPPSDDCTLLAVRRPSR